MTALYCGQKENDKKPAEKGGGESHSLTLTPFFFLKCVS